MEGKEICGKSDAGYRSLAAADCFEFRSAAVGRVIRREGGRRNRCFMALGRGRERKTAVVDHRGGGGLFVVGGLISVKEEIGAMDFLVWRRTRTPSFGKQDKPNLSQFPELSHTVFLF